MLGRSSGVTDHMREQNIFFVIVFFWFFFLIPQIVDLSCNELTEILIPEALPATLRELDLTGNTNLVLEHKTLDIFR